MVGNWTQDKVIRVLKLGPIEMFTGNVYSYTSSGTTSTSTTWTFTGSVTGKTEALERALTINYSATTTWDITTTVAVSRMASAADNNKYLGVFIEHAKLKVTANLFEWGCTGQVSSVSGTVYRAPKPGMNIRIADTIALVVNQELNAALTTGGTVGPAVP